MEQAETHREVRPIQAITGVFNDEMFLMRKTKQSLNFSRVAAANNASRFILPADLNEFLIGFNKR